MDGTESFIKTTECLGCSSLVMRTEQNTQFKQSKNAILLDLMVIEYFSLLGNIHLKQYAANFSHTDLHMSCESFLSTCDSDIKSLKNLSQAD